MTQAAGLAGYASSLPNFRNRIINGDMQIDQRNAGSAITNPNGHFPVDRFSVAQFIADTTTQRSSDAPTGFKNSLLITNGTATAVPVSSYNYTCYQKIEGYNIDDLGFASTDAKSITVSFWVKTSLDATFAVSILNAAEDRSYVHTFEIENTNTWEYKSFTLTADQDTGSNWLDSTGTGLRLNFDLGSGADYNTSTLNAWQSGKKFRTSSSANFNNSTNATFYITGVQLEEGTIATPFEHRPYGLELSLCQRYFSQTWGKWYGVTQAAGFFEGCAITWPVEMRTAPTTTVSDFYTGDPTNFTDISKVGLTDVRSTGAWFWASPAKVGGNVFVRAKCQAEAEL